jgi:predicted lipid-binding transport protein (Tim44 family)
MAQEPSLPQSQQAGQVQTPGQVQAHYKHVDRKKPWLAALLGILIVGLGHMYLAMWAKGIGLLVIGVIAALVTGGLLAPVFWIISCVWAYYDAKSYNRKAGYPS